MSSYIMHICISDIVKRKLNLTDKFVFGSILPDLLKSQTLDRDGTHYIEEVFVGEEKRKLPNIQRAICDIDIEDKEVRLGYIAHLIEDRIWFNDFIPSYATIDKASNIKYVKDGSIHTEDEFDRYIYSDYSNSNEYIVKKCEADIDKLMKSMLNIATDKIDMQPLLLYSTYPKGVDVNNNKFMTKESIDNYIEVCTKEVEKVVLKLIGE